MPIPYADDLLFLSTDEKDLQTQMYKLKTYCNNWKLKTNRGKSKRVVFNNKVERCHCSL
jgi:hypothetical protein